MRYKVDKPVSLNRFSKCNWDGRIFFSMIQQICVFLDFIFLYSSVEYLMSTSTYLFCIYVFINWKITKGKRTGYDINFTK